jgi:hypothetical protein
MIGAALLPRVLCAVVGLMVYPSLGFPQPEAHEVNLPFLLETINPCNGKEAVTIQGTLKILSQTTEDHAGGFHMKMYTTSRGHGIGAFSTYVYSEEEEIEFYGGGSSGTSVFSSVLNHLLTSASATDNFYMKTLVHLTIANGVPTATIAETTVDCRG